MRALLLASAVLLLALSAAPAHAESWFGLQGGVSTPLGDNDWKNLVDSSPKLSVNAGSIGKAIGGMVLLDWMPANTNTGSSTFPLGSTDSSGQRFRGVVGLAFQNPITSKLYFTGRVGAGIDIAHASFTVTFLGGTSTTSDTDIGPAFEVGTGLWAKVGSMMIGGELAIPIGYHDHPADNQGEIKLQYTSYDLDILFGVRFLTGSNND